MCREHNAYVAELDYGKEQMEQYRRRPDRVSEDAPDYAAGMPSVGGLLLGLGNDRQLPGRHRRVVEGIGNERGARELLGCREDARGTP
jgi:hypothetical protein